MGDEGPRVSLAAAERDVRLVLSGLELAEFFDADDRGDRCIVVGQDDLLGAPACSPDELVEAGPGFADRQAFGQAVTVLRAADSAGPQPVAL